MIEAEYTFDLPVPKDVVFAFISDPRNDMHWQSSCDGVELVDLAPSVGCRYRILFNFLGRKMHFLAEITEYEVPTQYSFRVMEGPFIYKGRYALSECEGGTRVKWQFSAEPGKFFGVIPAVLLRKVLIAQVQRDVQSMRQYLLVECSNAIA